MGYLLGVVWVEDRLRFIRDQRVSEMWRDNQVGKVHSTPKIPVSPWRWGVSGKPLAMVWTKDIC